MANGNRAPSTKQRRIDALTDALKQIERETRGYSQFSQMGSLNSLASQALRDDYKQENGIPLGSDQ